MSNAPFMSGRRVVAAACVFAAVAFAAHEVSLWALPRLIMHKVSTRLLDKGQGVVLPPLASESSREVVMPSPDLLYAICRVDLSSADAVIQLAPASKDYWSIALYDGNSDNFHVLNDRQAQGLPVSIRIQANGGAKTGASSKANAANDTAASSDNATSPSVFEQTVQAPGQTALVLMRLLVRDRSEAVLSALEKDRATFRCESVSKAGNASVPASPGSFTNNVATTNAATADKLSAGADAASLDLANRGLIARPSGQVKDAKGKLIWDYDSFDFLQGAAPATVNASLWRQALLNNRTGLFKVSEGIWQLRGFDLANMTLIEGKTGWIVVDPLTTRETATAAIAFARQHLGNKSVSAVIFTHSHVDHFGGVLGVISQDDAKSGRIPVVAPAGFMEEVTSENVMVGMAMARRSMYMYGSQLPRDASGLVDNGLGKAVAYGSFGIVEPNRIIEKRVEELTLDGRRFVFHNVPGSEAPSEFVFHLPDLRAFGGAELFGMTLHNLYTLRGAKVRDALKWSRYMDEMLAYAERSDVMFNQHNWPVWGRDAIVEHMTLQRDVYRYLHDQTVRMMNAGFTSAEISEQIKLPPELDSHLGTRGYYGTVRHNIKGIYQFYLGWYDAHPSNLNPLPPVEAANRYVELAGGIDAVIAKMRSAQQAGEHRWVAELGKHAVFAEPDNKQARELLATSFEKMGFAAEATTWRNAYLTGALELRQGSPKTGLDRSNFLDMLMYTPIERFLESMAAAINPERAAGLQLRINLVFTDTRETYALHLRRSILNHEKVDAAPPADATLRLTKSFFIEMLTGQAGGAALLTSSQTKIDGSVVKLGQFFRLLDKPDGLFNIVTP